MPLRWAGFDDVRSFQAKVHYLIEAGFGGAMVFSIDQEDAYGDCGQHEYPLLRLVSFHLKQSTQIKLPDADILFDLTWEKLIRERDQQTWLETYIKMRDSSKNTSK